MFFILMIVSLACLPLLRIERSPFCAEILRRHAIGTAEAAGELRLVAKTKAISYFGQALLVRAIGQSLARRFQALIPDPAAHGLVGVAKQFVQIARGDAAGPGDGFRVKRCVAQIFSDNGFNAGQMRLAHGGGAGGQGALIGFQGEHQKINELPAHSVAHLNAHGIKAGGDEMQHVSEQAACTLSRVELHGAEAVRRTQPQAQRLGLNFHHPQVGGVGVGKLIGLMAALQNKSAGVAAYVLSRLRKKDFRACRHGDQKMFVPLGFEVMGQAPVLQRLRCEPRQRHAAQLPI